MTPAYSNGIPKTKRASDAFFFTASVFIMILFMISLVVSTLAMLACALLAKVWQLVYRMLHISPAITDKRACTETIDQEL